MTFLGPKQKSLAPIASHKPRQSRNFINPGLVSTNASPLANMNTPLIQLKLTINKPGDKYGPAV